MALNTIPPALAIFDELPNSALIDVSVLALLFSCSKNTVWRRVRDGRLPKPIHVARNQTRWRVGDAREALAALGKLVAEVQL